MLPVALRSRRGSLQLARQTNLRWRKGRTQAKRQFSWLNYLRDAVGIQNNHRVVLPDFGVGDEIQQGRPVARGDIFCDSAEPAKFFCIAIVKRRSANNHRSEE